MTREECIGLLERYAEYHGMGIPNLAGCREAMKMAAELLSEPSLPSNLDEAAEEYSNEHSFHFCDYDITPYDAFKAGAEWMAGQEVKIGETKVYLEDDGDEPPYSQEWLDLESTEYQIPDGIFKNGDEVDVILRKKQ